MTFNSSGRVAFPLNNLIGEQMDRLTDPEYTSYVSLIVLGDKLVPAEVTSLLRLRPTQSWKRGDSKHLASGAKHQWGGWKRHAPKSQDNLSLPAQLSYWARTLHGRSDAFSKLTSEGYSCFLNCYIGTSETASVIISRRLQQALAELGLEMRLSVLVQSL